MLSCQLQGDCVPEAVSLLLCRIENPIAHAVTSCTASVPPLSFASAGSEISDDDKTVLRRIDEVALRTLRNCMQTVYEDGPRRDMRLW